MYIANTVIQQLEKIRGKSEKHHQRDPFVFKDLFWHFKTWAWEDKTWVMQ